VYVLGTVILTRFDFKELNYDTTAMTDVYKPAVYTGLDKILEKLK
jgi:hypothetical protein